MRRNPHGLRYLPIHSQWEPKTVSEQQALPEIQQFLGCSTPAEWIDVALQHQDLMLLDHKACEMKAASTAIMLMTQYSWAGDLVNKMSRLAREELRHFEQVLAILQKRDIEISNISASRYASALREHVRKKDPQRLVDILVIGAFIEARSCERFMVLAPHLDDELGHFYRSLLKSESRHFQDYLKLAYEHGDAQDVDERIAFFREVEVRLIQEPDNEFRFHSGIPVLAEASA